MNQCYIALLVIISTNGMVQLAKTEGFLDDHPDSYWLVVSVLSIEWRKGCLTTAGCVKPRFQLTKMNTANNEANLISWPIALKLAEERSDSFISHWISRSVSDIALKCEVTGLDPTYGFPRICDSTPLKHIFNDYDQNGHFERSKKVQYSNDGKVVVELKGKCFNASLAVQKYDRCPTCTEHHSIAVVEQYSDPEISNDFLHRLSSNRQFLYAVIILSASTVILTTGFACLLVAFLQQKHQLNVSTSKQSLNPEQSNIARLLRACDDDDSRYDMPLEHVQLPTTMHQRSLSHRNFNNKNDFMPMSHSVTAPITDVLALVQSDYRKASPSSSFGTELQDSGLGSV